MNVIGDNFDDFDLLPGVTLIRDRAKIRKIINKDIKPFTGIIEYEHLYNANHIIFADLKDDFFSAVYKKQYCIDDLAFVDRYAYKYFLVYQG